ncbi:BTAD domain-containing putative transcriptional regulator [Spongiactinospora sp. 9N601]|uniref:AfsR/SARP family transcriptional regulator n=1 Tax=Spongiactinospora sp. 9N601 TaxID=3375149 RepID=UPI00378C78F2
MRFRLLSEVDAYREGVWVHLGDRKQRLLLAVLLLSETDPVHIEQLIGTLWDGEPIKSARKVIHHYASDLRRHLGRARAGGHLLPEGKGGLYRVRAERAEVDVHRFRDQAREGYARLHDDDPEAVRLLRAALREWGSERLIAGEPLNGLTGRWAAEQRQVLKEEHRAAVIALLKAELRLGRHARIIPELSRLAGDGPPDEEVSGLLMLACYRSGRPAEALSVYAAYRERLADAGALPGAAIEHLRERVARRDPGLDLAADSAGFTVVSVDSGHGINGISSQLC